MRDVVLRDPLEGERNVPFFFSPMKPAKATGVDRELLFGRTLGLKEGPCPWAELILRRRSSTNKTPILPPQP